MHGPLSAGQLFMEMKTIVERPEACLSDTSLMLHATCLPTHETVLENKPGLDGKKAFRSFPVTPCNKCHNRELSPVQTKGTPRSRYRTEEACEAATESLQRLQLIDVHYGILGGNIYGVEKCTYRYSMFTRV